MAPSRLAEEFAQRILQAAIREGRAAELLECLFEGGSATIRVGNEEEGTLILIGVAQLRYLAAESADAIDPSKRD